MKKLVFYIALFFAQQSFAQLNVVPAPAQVKAGKGIFTISNRTRIVLEGSNLNKSSDYLRRFIETNYGIKFPKDHVVSVMPNVNEPTENVIVLNYERLDAEVSGAYVMEIKDNRIYIAGDNEEGVFYGVQTLLQLLKTANDKTGKTVLQVPQLSINDNARFAYRGAHLDVCRHFFSVDEVKSYIDHLAQYKFNKFHWHLTDDQGWRIEIKKYPKLTQVGGYRNGTIVGRYPGKSNDSLHYGGFYTQEQIRDVVKYAAERYIDVIPEIEMPGHASAAIAAYPQLSCFPEEDTKILETTPWAGSRKGKQVQQTWGVFEDVFAPTDYTFQFLQDVIDEIIPLFPSDFIHIGGDECPKTSWKRSSFCQQLIKENNLKDEHGLQSYFISRMEKYINKKGKNIIGWDEILEGGLAPNATVMSWRGENGGIAAAKQNHNVIMTPEGYCYLDHSQSKNEDSITIGSYLPIEKVYSYEPIPAALSADEQQYISGAQVNVWAEYIGNVPKLEYTIFPRMIAFSEVLWSAKNKRNWKDFERRLPSILERLDAQKINYSNAYYDLKPQVINKDGQIFWTLTSPDQNLSISYEQYVSGKGASTTMPYIGPIAINANTRITAMSFGKNPSDPLKGKILRNKIAQNFYINIASGKAVQLATPPTAKYAGDGAFTLVNGVQNSMGLVRSGEFLGFQGNDMEAVIDLGKTTFINEIILHAFEQTGSWIYRPASVSFYSSSDNINFKLLEAVTTAEGKAQLLYKTTLTEPARFVKVIAKNNGTIAEGKPGAGSAAWLFVDEIEVN